MVADLPSGTELAGYRVEALVGRGGMGVVYRALDLALDRPVALKILAPELAADVQFRERFLRESRLAASIDHPNVIPVYDAGEIGGELYLAMRFVEGADLKQLLADGPLEPPRAVALVSQVAVALDMAHARGLVHRDVKPSNVLVTADDHVYLADFGLTRRLGETVLAVDPSRSLGTADYVAPEQIRGDDVDGRADLYSLGCLLYECLTGRPPFRRDSEAATLFAHLEEEPPAPAGLESVMRSALAKDPDSRYQSGHELVEATRSALGLEPRTARWPFAAAAVGVALLGASLLAFFLTSGSAEPAEAGADSLVRIDPSTNAVTNAMPVGRVAGRVAVDPHGVWVTNEGDGTVWRIDPRTGRTLRLSAAGTPTALAVGTETVTVGDGPEHKIVSFDASSGVREFAASLDGGSNGVLQLAAGASGTWFADPQGGGGTGIVGRVDTILSSGTPSAQVAIPADNKRVLSSYINFDSVAAAKDAIWLAGDPQDHGVWRLDLATQRVASKIRLPFIPEAIAVGEGAVWVTSLLTDVVAKIDPRTDRIVATIPVGRGPYSIAVGSGAVWVTSAIDDALLRIDPAKNRVVVRIPLPGRPRAVAAGAGSVWVTTAKPVAPAPKGAIKIGVYADCQGPYGSEYEDSLAGAELPIVENGGRLDGQPTQGVAGLSIGGHPVRLYFGCDPSDGGSSTAQTLSEARRLVEQVGVDILISPTATVDELALQQYARTHARTTFIDGSGAAPDPDPAPNFFTFNTDGAQWMAGLGGYAYHTLGWRRAITIAGYPDAFTWAQPSAFAAEFCSLGGTIAKRIWYPLYTTDYSQVLSQIPRTGIDGIVLDDPKLLVSLAKSDPWLSGNLSRKVILTSAATRATLYKLKARASGIVSAGPGLLLPNADVPGLAAAKRFRQEFAAAFPHIPTLNRGFFDVQYDDAMKATLMALGRAHGDLSGAEKGFMAALAKVAVVGANGRVALDSRHEGIGPNYVWKLEGPKLAPHVIRTIPAVNASFGGYFKPTDPPPSETTPACIQRTPPPWAR